MKIETCPLCGKEAQLTSGSWTREAPATIECTTCGLILRNPRSIKEVIAAWNTRPEFGPKLNKIYCEVQVKNKTINCPHLDNDEGKCGKYYTRLNYNKYDTAYYRHEQCLR